ncbi:lipocalin family protein [Sphaerotilus sp.]|uniref:lipocalin family protein n=1 Tax=Sphaerotilus sp. TaxID=2093942 RepID=UPI002ACDAA0A|nr:lipocalin family protein [Sphaerotilus sp.]MDZ7856297.1 lipocalin family protein [Sphaerotilus sp.]
MKRFTALGAAAALAVLAGCATAPTTPLPTVASVDLARYAGAWYEVASLPNRFQKQCAADTQARYRQTGADIEVVNRCRTADGKVDDITGVAKVVEGSGNAKLRVSFFRPFYGDYWILALGGDADYGWVLVGESTRQFGWVLSRKPTIAPADLEAALARAEALGYARSAFKATPQTQPLP